MDGDLRMNFTEAVGEVRAVGQAVRALGLRPGDRVGVAMNDTADLAFAIQGVLWAGLTAVPLNIKLSVDKPTPTCWGRDAGVKALLYHAAERPCMPSRSPRRSRSSSVWGRGRRGTSQPDWTFRLLSARRDRARGRRPGSGGLDPVHGRHRRPAKGVWSTRTARALTTLSLHARSSSTSRSRSGTLTWLAAHPRRLRSISADLDERGGLQHILTVWLQRRQTCSTTIEQGKRITNLMLGAHHDHAPTEQPARLATTGCLEPAARWSTARPRSRPVP